MEIKRIPVTILTGYLGSGKTTLINHILTENHGKKIAIVENELGEINIDAEFITSTEEEIYLMNNCCLCCAYRGDLIKTLLAIYDRKDEFDYLIIETTGIADPSPIVQTFFMDSELNNIYYLDGIIAVVDTYNIEKHITRSPEFIKQISFADIVILNKIDLVEDSIINQLKNKMKSINSLAEIYTAVNANIDIEKLINIHAFDTDNVARIGQIEKNYNFSEVFEATFEKGDYEVELKSDFENVDEIVLIRKDVSKNFDEIIKIAEHVFEHESEYIYDNDILKLGHYKNKIYLNCYAKLKLLIENSDTYYIFKKIKSDNISLVISPLDKADIRKIGDYVLSAEHEESIYSLVFVEKRILDFNKFSFWLTVLLSRWGADIYRIKGILNFGTGKKVLFNGVHELLDYKSTEWVECEDKKNRLVFIGKNITKNKTLRGLEECFSITD